MKLSKTLLQIFTSLGAALTLGAGRVMALSVYDGAAAAQGEGMPSDLFGLDGIISRFADLVPYAVGFIAVIMLIWGGLRYILSGGDAKKITDAKNTILYALLGLIIAVFAYAIVKAVLQFITTPADSATEAAVLLSAFLA